MQRMNELRFVTSLNNNVKKNLSTKSTLSPMLHYSITQQIITHALNNVD
jgi:hypothetical protein